MKENIEHLKFPIGKFIAPVDIDETKIKSWIEVIRNFPNQLSDEVRNLSLITFVV